MPALTFSSTQEFPTQYGPHEAEVIPSKTLEKLILDMPEGHPIRTFQSSMVTGKFGRIIVPNQRDLGSPEVQQFMDALKENFWVLMTHDMDAALGRRDSGEFKTKLSFVCAYIDQEWLRSQDENAATKAANEARRKTIVEAAVAEETSTLIAAVRFSSWTYVLARNQEVAMYIDLDDDDPATNSYKICGAQPNDEDPDFRIDLLVASETGVPTGEVITVPVSQMLHVVPSTLPYGMKYNLELRQIFWYSDDGEERFNRWAVEGSIELNLKLDGRSDTQITVYGRHMYSRKDGKMNFEVNWPALGSETTKNTKSFAQCMNFAATMARSWEEYDTEVEE